MMYLLRVQRLYVLRENLVSQHVVTVTDKGICDL
jgi:hypothetical protein